MSAGFNRGFRVVGSSWVSCAGFEVVGNGNFYSSSVSCRGQICKEVGVCVTFRGYGYSISDVGVFQYWSVGGLSCTVSCKGRREAEDIKAGYILCVAFYSFSVLGALVMWRNFFIVNLLSGAYLSHGEVKQLPVNQVRTKGNAFCYWENLRCSPLSPGKH